MGRPSNTKERRQQIVDGMLRVIAARGYERATTAAIGEEAGLSPGLVHYHFKNKLEILLAVGHRLSALISERTEKLGEDLDAFVRAHLGFGEGADPAAVAAWVAVGAEAVFQPEVRALYQELLDQRQTALLSLLKAEFPAWDAAERRGRAELILALIEGYFQLSAAAPGTFEQGSAAGQLLAMIGRWRAEYRPAEQV